MSGSRPAGKSFDIDKRLVWAAWERVRSNKGAAGVDGQSIAAFETDLRNNLYKIWNRMSSGTYFPPPVRAVEIPKAGRVGVRVLGIPTVADRVAQTVVKMVLEPDVDPVFHQDSYGYRPGRSALDAVGACRQRCWKTDWVIDLDIKSFFDTVPHDLTLKAVEKHTDRAWIVLYVRRWLRAPLHQPDGRQLTRDRGTPQGSAISPLLANLFLHYAFDAWMARKYPAVRFERYCDDIVVHCRSEDQARQVLAAIAARLGELGLDLHPDKTRIVYCQDGQRRGQYPTTQFTFLGYDFRARAAQSGNKPVFTGFLPAVSKTAQQRMVATMRSWRIRSRHHLSLADLVRWLNPIIQGWIDYYGRFYRSELIRFLRRHVNDRIMRWARGKYKRLRGWRTASRRLHAIAQAHPRLFAHWRIGAHPYG